ncbi:hypothetical protein ACET9K_11905 [Aeromonas enteropelogenes]|uniref:hypothetical protein n=1 Tax=Aeromonas enteropelogenes TaxID=29489 RepID=UPI0038CFFB8C
MTDKAIDPRYAPPPELSIVWYSDPVDVHRELWRSAAEENGMTVDELLDSSEFMGLDIDGNEISVSNQQAFEGMAEMGCWGWVDTESNTIHAWADKDADPEMVLHMLAHEIGHVTGVPDSDPLQEEMRAEQFGFVAKLALRMMDGRNQHGTGGSKANVPPPPPPPPPVRSRRDGEPPVTG